jgi:hypothetical protein
VVSAGSATIPEESILVLKPGDITLVLLILAGIVTAGTKQWNEAQRSMIPMS